MENASLKWHFFLSHNQREGSGQSGSLHEIGLQNGVDSWLDVNQALMTTEKMKQEVQNSDTLVVVLTRSIFSFLLVGTSLGSCRRQACRSYQGRGPEIRSSYREVQ